MYDCDKIRGQEFNVFVWRRGGGWGWDKFCIKSFCKELVVFIDLCVLFWVCAPTTACCSDTMLNGCSELYIQALKPVKKNPWDSFAMVYIAEVLMRGRRIVCSLCEGKIRIGSGQLETRYVKVQAKEGRQLSQSLSHELLCLHFFTEVSDVVVV